MNKLACITGASSGIGAEFARHFAELGYDLVLTGRRRDKLEMVRDELVTHHPVNAQLKIVELSDESALIKFAEELAALQNLEVLVNNAGFGLEGSFHVQSIDQHINMLRVHDEVIVRLCHAVLPGMLGRGSGVIINVSSIRSFVPSPISGIYAASKAFVAMFSESLHVEYRASGIKVQALCPGLTRTDFHDKMGFNTKKYYKDKGLIKASTAREVVAASWRSLQFGKVVCIPGGNNKALRFFTKILPASVIYKFSILSAKKIARLKR